MSLHKLRKNKRGVSTVIVVVLSLVILVVVVANVVLWGYKMNQYDWERAKEDIKIVNITRNPNSSWFSIQSEYTLETGNKIHGTYMDTQTIGDQYESFMEGLNWWNVSYSYRRQITIENHLASPLNVGYSVWITINTASLISVGKMLSSGNDLRVVYWAGSSWIELDRDVININSNSTQVWFKTQAAIEANGSDSNYYIYYGNLNPGSPPTNKSNVYLWFDDFDRADRPDITIETSYSVKTGGGTWSIEANQLKNIGAAGDPNKLIITALGNVNTAIDMLVKIKVTSFAGGDNSRMGLSCCMDASPSRGSGYCGLFHQDTNRLDLLNDLRSWGTQGTYAWSLNTWYYMRFRVIDPTSKFGTVKVWQVGTIEPVTWTVDGNFGGGTARSFGEVGFAGSRTTDTTYFDDILIRYITNQEPSTSLGTEESQINNRLDIAGTFTIDTFTYPLTYIQTVEIQMRYRPSDTGEKWYLKAYNWTSSTYSDNGFNSTTGNMPTTGWDYYAVNLTNQWKSYVAGNGTVVVKVIDEMADANQTTIDIDFLTVRVKINGAKFTFHNEGSSTCHLVSLWINNSTEHKRYDVNLFINSGDTLSYLRVDTNLPNRTYLVKVITERGNTAVFFEK
jgi:nitrogen fixation-related uncharacterized protein